MCNDITLKSSSHEKILGVTIDNKLSFDEHITNINKKTHALSRINHYMKQNQKKILFSSFIIPHFSHCPFIWMFCSKKSTQKMNAVHERSLRIIRNDCEFPHALLLKEAHQITFHQQCINSVVIVFYKHLNWHLPGIINDIFKLRENVYYLKNFHIFQTEKPRSLKYGTRYYSISC